MYNFETSTARYTFEATGVWGRLFVLREDKATGEVSDVGSVDMVKAVPATRGGNILEERLVAFYFEGRVIARTSFTGSDTYNKFQWGTFEEGRFPQERNLPSHLPQRPQERITELVREAFVDGVRVVEVHG